jgi:alpha-tubulin suppressor-like RCC1 family protein
MREFSTVRNFKVRKMTFGKDHGLILFHQCGEFLGVFGNNENGQLGIKLKQLENDLMRFLNLSTKERENEKESKNGNDHNQTHEGETVFTGKELSTNYYDTICLNQISLKEFNINSFEILDIACGDDFSLLLIKDIQTGKTLLFKFCISEKSKISFHSKNEKGEHLDDYKVIHREDNDKMDFKISKIYASNERTILLSDDNSIYCKGLGFDMGIYEKYRQIVNKFDKGRIVEMNLGGRFLLFLTDLFELYAIGDNDYGELGIDTLKCAHQPSKITFFEDYACMKKENEKRTKNGLAQNDNYPEVQTKGSKKDEKEILPEDKYKENMINADKKKDNHHVEISIKKVSVGSRHTMVLTSNNKVYCFGDNSDGQCSGFTQSNRTPTKVKFLGKQKIVDIAAGETHSLALSENGELFSWGDCSFDKLGYHENQSNQRTARPVPFIKGRNISMILAGPQQSVVITSSYEESKVNKKN